MPEAIPCRRIVPVKRGPGSLDRQDTVRAIANRRFCSAQGTGADVEVAATGGTGPTGGDGVIHAGKADSSAGPSRWSVLQSGSLFLQVGMTKAAAVEQPSEDGRFTRLIAYCRAARTGFLLARRVR